MASEIVDPIDSSHPPPSWAVPHELHVLHRINAAYKSQDLLHQPRLEPASTGMPDQRTACAATQWVKLEQQLQFFIVFTYVALFLNVSQCWLSL